MQDLSTAQNKDYLAELAGFVRAVRSEGVPVVIAPHSLSSGKSKNNDLNCAAKLARQFSGDTGVVLIDAPLNARVLRALFGLSRCAVTSRFHACVAAVSTGVPVIALAWGHKYHDLLVPFGLGDLILDGVGARTPDIIAAWRRLMENERAVRAQVQRAAVVHRKLSRRNFSHLAFRQAV